MDAPATNEIEGNPRRAGSPMGARATTGRRRPEPNEVVACRGTRSMESDHG
jgi:hypothetical protein